MHTRYLALPLLILTSVVAFSQENYRTRATGDWSDPSIWQRETPNGSGVWVAAISPPDNGDNNITVRNGHSVTVSGNLTIDQTSVYGGGTLTILDGVTLTVNNGTGVDLFLYNLANLHLLGESTVSGLGYLYVAGTVHTHSTNPTGAITAGATSGNIRIATRYWGATAVVRYSASATQFIGDGHPSGSGITTVINNPANVDLNNTASTLVTLGGPVQIIKGQLVASNDNLIANGSITINGGSLNLSNATGLARTHTINALSIVNGGVTVSTGAASPVTLTINGQLDLQSGNINASSGSSNFTLNIYGDITGTGLIQTSGVNNLIRFYGSNSFTHSFPLAQNSTVKTFTIDRPGLVLTVPYSLNIASLSVNNGSVILGASQTLSGSLNLATGTSLNFSGASLTLNYNINNVLSGGVLVSNSLSNLTIGGSTATAGTIAFSSGSALNNFTLNRSGGGSVTTTGEITITGALNLTRGSLVNNGGISMGNGSTISRNSICSMNGLAPTGGPYNLTYSGLTLITGIEATGWIANFTSNATGIVTLQNALNVSGNIQVNSGTLSPGSNAISGVSLINAGIFNAPTSTLSLSGNLVSTGAFNINTCDLILTGTVDQSISTETPVQFNDITLTKSAGTVRVETNENLRGVLTVSDGTQFDADGSLNTATFTLLSLGEGPEQDARIAAIPPTSSVTGHVTVRRFISAIDNTHRFISSPVASASVSQLQDDLSVTGNFVGTSYPCTGCTNNNPSLRWFNELSGGSFNSRYAPTPVPSGDNAEILVPGRGYDIYMWNGVSSTLIDLTGPVNQGPMNFEALTYTPSAVPNSSTDGWHLLGNPYPSPIVWNNTGWSRENMDPVVWIWDEAGQVWRSANHNNPELGNLVNGVIAAGQGFWVRANVGGGSLSINENAKSMSSDGIYYRDKTDVSNGVKMTLSQNGIEDHAYLLLNASGTPGFDIGLDAYKPVTGNERMSVGFLDPENSILGYATFAEDNLANEIPLSVAVREAGVYEIGFESSTQSDNFSSYVLLDKVSNKIFPMRTRYTFEVADGKTILTDRFYLVKNSDGINAEYSEVVSYYPNPVDETLSVNIASEAIRDISIFNNLGQAIETAEFEQGGGYTKAQISVRSLEPGMYLLNIVFSNNTRRIYKLIKQ